MLLFYKVPPKLVRQNGSNKLNIVLKKNKFNSLISYLINTYLINKLSNILSINSLGNLLKYFSNKLLYIDNKFK